MLDYHDTSREARDCMRSFRIVSHTSSSTCQLQQRSPTRPHHSGRKSISSLANVKMKTAIETISAIWRDLVDFLPPGMILATASAFLQGMFSGRGIRSCPLLTVATEGKFLGIYVQEFLGTLIMVAFTFSAGKWNQ